MNEQGFWDYCKEVLMKDGKVLGDYPQISQDKINEIGEMLLDLDITAATKERAILLLAHQQSKTAIKALRSYIHKTEDPDLKKFAQFGLEECIWWNE